MRETGRLRERGKTRLVLGLLQLIPALLAAQQRPAIDSLFPAAPTGYVTDVAGVVDPASAARIEDLAARLRTATGAELAVVSLPTLGNQEISGVALEIGRSWGVGAKAEIGDATRNAGIVLLLVPRREGQSGGIYLSTGRGIEGIIPDAMAGRILDAMVPQLREGQYGPALVTGTEAIAAAVARGFGVTDSALTAADPFRGGGGGGEDFPNWVALLLIFLIFVLPMILNRGRRGRGPRIGPGGFWGPGWGGGGWGGGFGGGGFSGGGGFGGFGGGGGFSGGGAGRSF